MARCGELSLTRRGFQGHRPTRATRGHRPTASGRPLPGRFGQTGDLGRDGGACATTRRWVSQPPQHLHGDVSACSLGAQEVSMDFVKRGLWSALHITMDLNEATPRQPARGAGSFRSFVVHGRRGNFTLAPAIDWGLRFRSPVN